MSTIKLSLFIFIILISNCLLAYDAVIKDKYGRVSGYLDKDDDKTYIVDKYGKRGDFIEPDGTIKDKYGRTKGKIEKND
jgi:hypothetical protein